MANPNHSKGIKINAGSLFFLLLAVFIVLLINVYLLLNKNLTYRSSAAGSLVSVSFQPDNNEIPNPERGFMRQSNIFVDQPFDPSKIGKKDPNDTVDWVYFHLENYRDPRDGSGIKLCADLSNCTSSEYQGKLLEPLGSGKGLDTVKATFDTARSKGLKLVIRFIYNWGPGSSSDPLQVNPDVPLSVALQHLNQLKPLIIANTDVIVAVQAGFVGHWGEGHSSKYLDSLTSRKAIIDELLAVVPADRMLQVRYPRYVEKFYGGPIAAAQAFNQSGLSRIGLHDDAFLRDDTDGNTFNSSVKGQKISTYCDSSPNAIQCWRDYYSQTSQYTPSGGEAGTHSSTPSTFAACSNALTQLSKQHFSFLNNGYSLVTLNNWVNQGCMPEIRRRLGYRFVLNKLTLLNQVAPGGNLELHLDLINQGFASPYNPRPVYLVLRQSNASYVKEIALTSVDPRRWLPGQTINVDLNVPIPQDVPNGSYSVYLWLPDASASIKTRSEYAIRFANQNIWQSGTGYNLIFSNLAVSGSPVTPIPTSILSPTPLPSSIIKSPTPGSLSPTSTPPTPTQISPTPGTGKPGDANGDGRVNSLDLWIWLLHFGQDTVNGAADGDFNLDKTVGVFDFVVLLQGYGS